MFKNTSTGTSKAVPIVYDLRSKVVKRKSVGREEINDVRMYEAKERFIMVTNPFDKEVQFRVTLEHLRSIKHRGRGPWARVQRQCDYAFVFLETRCGVYQAEEEKEDQVPVYSFVFRDSPLSCYFD
jgi:hypothetical protein